MDMRIELLPLPASDPNRSKEFYVEGMGFRLDHDVQPSEQMRVIQLTPPGSACSIVIGEGIYEEGASPVKGIHLVVPSINEARADLRARGVAVSDVQDMGGIKYAYLQDPDGNSWALQELPSMPSD